MTDAGRNWLARRGRHSGVGHGATLLEIADGPGRGTRLLDMLAGPDLCVRVAIDRGFEIAEIHSRGNAVGWSSPVHLRAAALQSYAEDDGLGFLRSFSGMLTTCGLDHIGLPARTSAEHYGYPGRAQVSHPLHGRVAFLPATLDGYGITEGAQGRILWAQGSVIQAMVFGEHLNLVRRIEMPLFGHRLEILDRVENRGSRPVPHALLYHWDFGWPLLDEGVRIMMPPGKPFWCSDTARAGHDRLVAPAPTDGYGELVYAQRPLQSLTGQAEVRLDNAALGLTAVLGFRPQELPVLLQWQAYEPGIYALGIEPATQMLGDAPALLSPGDVRHYHQTLRLDWRD